MDEKELREKIEEARQSGELDLMDNQLTELPPEIVQLTSLTSLDLSNNQLTELPPEIVQLTSLTSLNLSNNQLTELPPGIGQLTSLTLLILSSNQLTELPPEIVQLTSLTRLNLSFNGLTELPPEIVQLTSLTSLSLMNNQLTELPPEIVQLTSLTSLSLYSNQLSELPPEIGQLTSLTALNLSYNQLTELPPEIVQLTSLTELSLSNNQLTELPPEIVQLTSLTSLDLVDNKLTELPPEIEQLTSLTKQLALSNNELPELPSEIGQLTSLTSLYLGGNHLTELPSEIGQLTSLVGLHLWNNQLTELPPEIGQLTSLTWLDLSNNQLTELPPEIVQLTNLTNLSLYSNQLSELPPEIGQLTSLTNLSLYSNQLSELPPEIGQLTSLTSLDLDGNPLDPELAAAYEEDLDSVMAYLRAKAGEQITLNEAKLILVGEGDVGKTCLMDALQGAPWQEHDTTHGIEIRSVQVVDSKSGTEISLNGWDFGGQRVYRPTHQLFFSSSAVYLVVWKPREGLQQGLVREWIKLVKHREPDAKILVVATHGGPKQRQPDIDRQELWDLFGKDTVIDFFHVESKPDEKGKRRGIEELKQAIAGVAFNLPEMGRSVPKRWQDVREALEQTEEAYLPLERVLELCREHKMDDDEARLFVTIEHRLGHFIHYEHDPALRDIVVLRPDWLATAISFVLDDEETRKEHGLVHFSRLSQLWDDPSRTEEFRCPADLHPIFFRLMERFDLSYRVDGLPSKDDTDSTSLIAQLVPDTRPETDLAREWPPTVESGDIQQMQTCLIVNAQNGQSATAEGLFYQLIVRLHKCSLGRINHNNSVHWQRGLVLDDDYNGRALLEHIGNDVHITVRAPYPERFLAMLTSEVKYLVESFWEGLRCNVMVPCVTPCGKDAPGTGLYEVQKLIESKRRGRPEYPCPVCNEWQDINSLLRNAPAARPVATEELLADPEVLDELRSLRHLLVSQHGEEMGRFDNLDAGQQELLSKADASYTSLMKALTDEAKEGPRLFTFVPIARSRFNPREWTRSRFRLTLWCEHSRLPLPFLNGKGSKKGVYDLELTRDWFKKAAPYLKLMTGTLSLVLPVASSAVKLALDETAYKAIEEQLDFGQKIIAATIGEGAKISEFMGAADKTELEHGAIRAQGATLRELHALLKAKDPGFGGLVRVMNKRQEFLWVHHQFEEEY